MVHTRLKLTVGEAVKWRFVSRIRVLRGKAGSFYLTIFRHLIILLETIYALEVGKTRVRFFSAERR